MTDLRLPSFEFQDTSVTYSCLDFPFSPWEMVVANNRDQRTARVGASYVDWIREIEAERSPYSFLFFAEIDCLPEEEITPRQFLFEFETALRPWLRRVMEPGFGSYWFYSLPNGAPSFAPRDSVDHDAQTEALEISLALDVSLVVVELARRVKPLEWVVSTAPTGSRLQSGRDLLSHMPTLSPGHGNVYPISEAYAGVQFDSMSAPGSRASARVNDHDARGLSRLYSLYEALVTGHPLGGPVE